MYYYTRTKEEKMSSEQTGKISKGKPGRKPWTPKKDFIYNYENSH
jgi:hypothetical protein